MESIFSQGLYLDEGEGLRISLSKEDKIITPSGIDFKFSIIDNNYDHYPEVHISYNDTMKIVECLQKIIADHHNLFKEERKK